jgi:hypothetical protein
MTEPALHYSIPAYNKNPLPDNTWKTNLYNIIRKSGNLLISDAVNIILYIDLHMKTLSTHTVNTVTNAPVK